MDSTLADRTLMEWRDSYIYYMMTVIYIYIYIVRYSDCHIVTAVLYVC